MVFSPCCSDSGLIFEVGIEGQQRITSLSCLCLFSILSATNSKVVDEAQMPIKLPDILAGMISSCQ